MTPRIQYIDVAKTICIFLMVVGHWTSNNVLLTYIYSFHMPALFVISGMLFKPRSWIRTVLSFGIPVIFYSFLNLLFLLVVGEVTTNQLFTKELFFRFFHYRYGLGTGLFMGDWFIWALLALRLFFGDIRFLNGSKKYYICISILTILFMTFESYLISVDSLCRGWYYGRALPSLPFFCMGFYLKEKGWRPEMINKKVVLFLLFVSLTLPIANGYSSINENVYGLSYVIFFIIAACSTLLLLYISSYIRSSKPIMLFSKGTLLILGLHIPIMKMLDMLFPSYMHEFLPLLVLPICYYPILWLEKTCPPLLGIIRGKNTCNTSKR